MESAESQEIELLVEHAGQPRKIWLQPARFEVATMSFFRGGRETEALASIISRWELQDGEGERLEISAALLARLGENVIGPIRNRQTEYLGDVVREYLASDNPASQVPEWYKVIKSAQALGMPPWELAKERPEWIERGWQVARAELAARFGPSPKSAQ